VLEVIESMEDGAAYLGKYELRGILGRGGMGVVYEGYDPHIERVVAIKTIRLGAFDEEQQQELLARFKREAQAVGRLSHPNIVQVYEYGEHEGKPYIAMEFVKGRELGDLLEQGERYELASTVHIAEQMLAALAYCHSHGVVHRDLKPANLLMLDDGTVKLTDFGIARVESSTLTVIGAVMGTPNYMSPEQLSGQGVDARSDLFAAGVMLYELITGEKPFPGKTIPVIMNRVMRAEFEAPSSINVHLTPSWDRLLARALGRRPADRFQSAQDFLAALRLAVEDRYEDEELDADEGETLLAGAAPGGLRAPPAAAPREPTARRSPQTSFAASPPAQAAASPVPSPPRRRRAAYLAGVLAVLVLAVGVAVSQTGRLDDLLATIGFTLPARTPDATPSVSEAWRPARSEPPPAAPIAAAVQPPAPVAAGAPPPAPSGDGALDVRTEDRAGSYYALISAVTEPAGATLLIDEVEFGQTPLELDVPPGVYQMRLRMSGFRDLETEVQVDPATAVRVTGRLRPQ
jgi:serine/threonine-protein kinase